jgi:hypothetical protein
VRRIAASLSHAFTVSVLVLLTYSRPVLGIAIGQSDDRAYLIEATVMDVVTRQPVSDMEVELSPPNPTPFDIARRDTVAVSDEKGQVTFSVSEIASYDLAVRSPDGHPEISRLRKSVSVTDARPLAPAVLWVTFYGTVSGRVFDPSGDPVSGASVNILGTAEDASGSRYAVMASDRSAITDEDGAYSISGPPGIHYVYVIPDNQRDHGAALYYPGVRRIERAIPISITSRGELPAVDFSIGDETPSFTAQFRLPLDEIRTYGPPVTLPRCTVTRNGNVETEPCPLDELEMFEVFVRASGRDQIRAPVAKLALESLDLDVYRTSALPPGDYELLFVHPSYIRRMFPNLDWDNRSPITRIALTLEDEDVDLGTLQYAPRQDIPGRVTLVSSPNLQLTSEDVPELILSSMDFGLGSGSKRTQVASDGSFIFTSVSPGYYEFALSRFNAPLPSGAYLLSARSAGRNVARDGLVVGGSVGFIEVVIAADGARLRGVVVDQAEAPIADVRVVAIPPPDRRGVALTFPTTKSDDMGAFDLRDIPPGNYRLLAIDTGGRTEDVVFPYWETPIFLREYERFGERITVDPDAIIETTLTPVVVP